MCGGKSPVMPESAFEKTTRANLHNRIVGVPGRWHMIWDKLRGFLPEIRRCVDGTLANRQPMARG
jgi:hypothetical protein